MARASASGLARRVDGELKLGRSPERVAGVRGDDLARGVLGVHGDRTRLPGDIQPLGVGSGSLLHWHDGAAAQALAVHQQLRLGRRGVGVDVASLGAGGLACAAAGAARGLRPGVRALPRLDDVHLK